MEVRTFRGLPSSSQLTSLSTLSALEVLDQLEIFTLGLVLPHNHEFGLEGITVVVQGIIERDEPVWGLTSLRLDGCGLGGPVKYSFRFASW